MHQLVPNDGLQINDMREAPETLSLKNNHLYKFELNSQVNLHRSPDSNKISIRFERDTKTYFGCPGDLIVGEMKPTRAHLPWLMEFNLRDGTNKFWKQDGASVTGKLKASCKGGVFYATLTDQSHGVTYECKGINEVDRIEGWCRPNGGTNDSFQARFSVLLGR